MNIKRTPLLIMSLVALTGCVDRAAQEQAKQTEELIKDPTTVVEVMQVTSSTVADTLDITGTIETSDDVTVTALVGGAIIAVYVQDGDEVTVGQIIAIQDDESFRVQVAQARAQMNAAKSALDQAKADAEVGPQRSAARVAGSQARIDQAKARLKKLQNGARPEEISQAKAQVDKAKSDLDTAKLALDRAKRLYGEGAVPKSNLELAENSYSSALSSYQSALDAQSLVQRSSRQEDITAAEQDVRAEEQQHAIYLADQRLDVLFQQKVESADANWQAAKQMLNLANIALTNTQLRSPFSGRISGKPLQVGTYIMPGVPFVRIIGVGGAYFEAEIPESKVALVQTGSLVQISLDALPGQALHGSVSAISPQATGAGRLFLARIRLDSVPSAVRAGMFARGVVTLGERSGIHLLPSEAVVRDGENTHVFLMSEDKASRAEVKIGKTQNGQIEVVGLKEGDTVIIKGQTIIGDGSLVRIEGTKEA